MTASCLLINKDINMEAGESTHSMSILYFILFIYFILCSSGTDYNVCRVISHHTCGQVIWAVHMMPIALMSSFCVRRCTDLQGGEDGLLVGDKGSKGVGTEVLAKGFKWVQSTQIDLESEEKK